MVVVRAITRILRPQRCVKWFFNPLEKSNGGGRMLGVKGEGVGEDADSDAGDYVNMGVGDDENKRNEIPVTECWGVIMKVLEV